MSKKKDEATPVSGPTPGVEKKPSVEIYERPDGRWSFRVDGQESGWSAPTQAGVIDRLNAIANGTKPGGISVKAIRAGDKVAARVEPVEADWAAEKTPEARMKAFMSRGKLGKKEGA